MFKLAKLKEKKAPSTVSKAAQFRLQKDLSDLNLPKMCWTEFPNPDDLFNFNLIICPTEGYYDGGRFVFSFCVDSNYPHSPPKVKCMAKIYHPNIDLEGNVCLNILREDWNPVLSISSIVFGLQFLFLEPNPEDPLNKEAANTFKYNKHQFAQNVRMTMRGYPLVDINFDYCLLAPKPTPILFTA